MYDFLQYAAATRAQANQEKANRKLNVPEKIISKDKEAFKQAQDSYPILNCIRQRVESGSVTISRGLNRGETKFVLKKDLMYGQFTKGNKLTLQLVTLGKLPLIEIPFKRLLLT